MRQEFTGQGAARGSALGRARVRLPHVLEVAEERIPAEAIEDELERLHRAIATVREEMHGLRDRLHEALGEMYSPLHPAVVRLIRDVIRLAQRKGKPVAVCGEIAGDARFVPMLLAMGLTELSLHPVTLLEVRRTIRACDLQALKARAPSLLKARGRLEIERWMAAAAPDLAR